MSQEWILRLFCGLTLVMSFAVRAVVHDSLSQPTDNHLVSKSMAETVFDFCHVGPQFAVSPNLISARCRDDLRYVEDVHGLTTMSYSPQFYWQQQMLDSYGKLPAGLTEGNVFFFGDFIQCAGIQVWKNASFLEDRDPDFQGKFCIHNFNHYVQNTIGLPSPVVGTTAVCVPSTCTAADVEVLFNEVMFPFKTSVTEELCSTTEQSPHGWITFLGLALFGVLGVLSVFGTLIDVVPRIISDVSGTGSSPSAGHLSGKGKISQVLMGFSVYTNTINLLDTSKRNIPLSCINGIRVLSMYFVVAGHFGILVLYLPQGRHNPTGLLVHSHDLVAQPYLYGAFTVESFFCLSGFLVTFITADIGCKKGGAFNMLAFYAHRMWRITPTYFLLALSATGPFQLLGNGPMWNVSVLINKARCEDTLWSLPFYLDIYADMLRRAMCLPHAWYLNVEMFYYLVCPVILYPLVKRHWSWKATWSVLLAATTLTAGLVGYVQHVNNIFTKDAKGNDFLNFFLYIYTKPWARGQSFLVGMLFGYFYYKYGKNLRLDGRAVGMAWIMTGVIIISCIYGNYRYTADGVWDHPSRVVNALYVAFGSMAWATAVGWMILACATGHGGVINSILSWKVFVPLGRLSFSAYLVHLHVLVHFSSSRKWALYTDRILFAYGSFAVFLVVLVCAYLVYVFIEGPCLAFEHSVFRRKRFEKKTT